MNTVSACLGSCALSALLVGCITTADRSGDRSESLENGFFRREWLATYRMLTSPVTVASASMAPFRCETLSTGRALCICPTMAVWGLVETGEELAVGLTELLSGCQFRSCAYPMERFALDVADWRRPSASEVRGGPASSETASVRERPAQGPKPQAKRNYSHEAVDGKIRAFCEKGEWAKAARTCREYLSKSETGLELILNGTRLAMINWNMGDRLGAIIAMDTVVAACSAFGTDCEARAKAFGEAFRTGCAKKEFSVEEVTECVGIRKDLFDMASAAEAR